MEIKESLIKRIFDVFLALFGLILSFPFWVIIIFLIWLEDKGPIFYIKEVLGKKERKFLQIKFRTMVPNASEKIPVHTSPDENSPYITKTGRILRKTAMDELPQLVNILKGDMSFVGPRPYPAEVEGGENVRLRRAIRPGLTGMAQIFSPKGVSLGENIKFDLEYIKKRNFWLDLKLIFLSFWITFRKKWETREKKI